MDNLLYWALPFWIFCATVLIIGSVVWLIQLDRKIRRMESEDI
jgi:hypothetical protein